MKTFIAYLIRFIAMLIVALILNAVIPGLYGPLRVGIAVGLVYLAEWGLSSLNSARVGRIIDNLTDGSHAKFGDQIFTRDKGYWSDGEQALTNEQLREMAKEHGGISYHLATSPGVARLRSDRSEE